MVFIKNITNYLVIFFIGLIVFLNLASCGSNSPQNVIPSTNTAARDGAVRAQMRIIYHAEESFKIKKGRYGTLIELVEEGDLNKDPQSDRLSRYIITATEETFECSAVPMIYKTTGLQSLFIDQTGQLRGADHNGQPSTSSDPLITE